MRTTRHTTTINGLLLSVPNVVDNSPKGYYVSYNNWDIRIYGSDTTAIVIDETGAFLILNGDHRAQLKGLSLAMVCEYFHNNVEKKNKLSNDHQDDVLEKINGKWQIVRKPRS